ncbi:Stk1 family PASTA domain-containing Ser/Thr kinase [Lachnospiraceae bacterium OM04-12BH]|jgi:PASTA domain-containing serine/threonine protein kinase|nr:Stk1 family PASTA domain-containing Ser/Thr kinase [Lachnospiraceae bacterium OM04-12BH]
MIKIGMMIGDRYEILEKIGTGGMSDVYKAKDHKLNRFIAVKVLKQEFSENANFVSKFRIEAQAAAGLMHPNIVNVYDVGEEDGIYYIVMELVEGITLKKYIEKKARLSVKEAVSIAIQVSMGIEAAHNNHIIHRDIKPQNIMISKEGKVKVTDFGIAKAATSNTITSNVMGSVHYTSPEQARGGYSDERSDIYSLGITIFEMLTGRVPFNGETTVAIAIKHIQEDLPSPRDFVPEIPVSVEQIVFKCCQKSPDRRYQSMGELITDLKRSLMTPDENFVKQVNADEEASTRMISDKDYSQIKKQSGASIEEAMHLRKEEEVRRNVQKKQQPSGQKKKQQPSGKKQVKRKPKPQPQPPKKEREDVYHSRRKYEPDEDYEIDEELEEDDEEEETTSGMERLTTILAIVAAVIIGCIILFLAGRAIGLFHTGGQDSEEEVTEEKKQVEMIDVVGKNIDDVKVALLNINLTPEIQYEENTQYAQGIVIKASANVGEMVDEGTNIVLTVSAGSEGIEVPKVVGLSEAEAVSNLEQKGFQVSKTSAADQYIQKGNVISQSPEGGSKAFSGATVTICISTGIENAKISVPDVMGKSEDEAMSILVEAGLQLGSVTEVTNNNTDYLGLVCYQSYSARTYVDAGTRVDIHVSVGPAQATYRFTDSITPPTSAEDPNYKSGTMVTVTLMADDGTQLMSTQTSSFPIAQQNITGIKTSTGYILFQYQNTIEGSTITNEDGSVTTTEGSTENKEIRRAVNFVQE